MSKLLYANLSRLRRERAFWAALLFMFLLGVCTVYSTVAENPTQKIDFILFRYTTIIGIPLSAVGYLFLGTEYRDGGIRNKLIVGHKRCSIYLANWLTVVIAGLLMSLAYLMAVLGFGLFLLEGFQKSAAFLWMVGLGSFLLVVTFASFIAWLGMAIESRSLSVTLGLLGMIALLLLSFSMEAMLSAPEFQQLININSSGDMMDTTYTIPNPHYLEGMKREIYQGIHNVLPTGQAIQYSQLSMERVWPLQLSALLLSVLSTCAGMFQFCRKDFK